MGELTDAKQRAQALRRQGDLKGAAETLRHGIEQLGDELADLHGVLGGTLRDLGDLVGAVAAYDEGARIDGSHRSPSSYNALNRLVTRILLAPRALADPEALRGERRLELVNVPATLAELQAQLQRQLEGIRAGDFWAAGDLAVTAALNGDLDAATRAVQRFAGSSPPPSAYGAYRQTLETLARLDTPRRATLERVRALLERPPG
jgi:tetratricopeptide (TPR) repeat protein